MLSEMDSVLQKITFVKKLEHNIIFEAKSASISQDCLGIKNPSMSRICYLSCGLINLNLTGNFLFECVYRVGGV